MDKFLEMIGRIRSDSTDVAKSAVEEDVIVVPDVEDPYQGLIEDEDAEILVLDSDLIRSFKSDNPSLEHPFFALQAKGGEPIRRYKHNDVEITLTANAVDGFATVYDKDVWIYCLSKILKHYTDTGKYCLTVEFKAYDFLKQTRRSKGGRGYALFRDSLNRLSGTRMQTNITTNGIEETDVFPLITYSTKRSITDKKEMTSVRVSLPVWLVRTLISKKEILTINSDYFNLAPLERRLYEIARKHCGKTPGKEFPIGLDIVYKKTGTTMQLRFFKASLKKIIEKQPLPDYTIRLDNDEKDVVFTRK